MVEALVAIIIMGSGMLAAARVFIVGEHTNVVTERRTVATHIAERELEDMKALDFSQLALQSPAVDSGDPAHPKSGGTLFIAPNQGPLCYQIPSSPDLCGYERLHVDATDGTVDPGGPTSGRFTVSGGGKAISGTIFRYVTKRGECAPATQASNDTCSYKLDTKRITVAVTIDGPEPVERRTSWLSSIVEDPALSGDGDFPAGDTHSCGSSGCSSSTYYLYDTPCNYSVPIASSGDHVTRNTTSFSNNTADASYWSVCANGPSGRAADLMEPRFPGPDWPSAGTADEQNLNSLPNYSSDVTGSDTGLRLERADAPSNPAEPDGCSPYTKTTNGYSYNARTIHPVITLSGQPGKKNMHRWSTPVIANGSTLHADGFDTAAVTLWTRENAIFCVTLLSRNEGSVWPFATETTIAHTRINRQSPSDRWVPFTQTFKLNGEGITSPYQVPTGNRLVLAISMLPTSSGDLQLAYGYPTYPASLTLMNCSGGSCAS